jgi:hypothetical protein
MTVGSPTNQHAAPPVMSAQAAAGSACAPAPAEDNSIFECADPVIALESLASAEVHDNELRSGAAFTPVGSRVALFSAPSQGKGFGLFTVDAHPIGTVIAHVNCAIVPDGKALPHLDYIQAGRGMLLACLPATVAKPGGLANTQTAFLKNNSKFVITAQSVDSVLVHAVKIVTTRRVQAGMEVYCDYGAEYRQELRRRNCARKKAEKKCLKRTHEELEDSDLSSLME